MKRYERLLLALISLLAAAPARAGSMDTDRTNEISIMEALDPTDCWAWAPPDAACSVRTKFSVDLIRRHSDRKNKRMAEVHWILIRQPCVNGVCAGEMLWDMGVAGRHDVRRSNPRQFSTRPLVGMKGTYTYDYEASGPAVVEPMHTIALPVGPGRPCVESDTLRLGGWETQGKGHLAIENSDGTTEVSGPAIQRQSRRVRRVMRVPNCD